MERRIAFRRRWLAGALATMVAGALVFSGVTPAVADEAVTSDAATGGEDSWPLAVFGFLTLLAGAATLIVVRRRRDEAGPTP